MKMPRKSGFTSWRRVCIIVGHLYGPHFDSLGLGCSAPSWPSAPSLMAEVDARAGPSRRHGRGSRREETDGSLVMHVRTEVSSSLVMHLRTEVLVAGIGHGCRTDSKELVGPGDDLRIKVHHPTTDRVAPQIARKWDRQSCTWIPLEFRA